MAIKGMSLTIIDNSGAKTAEVIGIPGNSITRRIKIGQIVKVAIKTALPSGQGKVSKGDHKDFYAVVVSLRNPINRKNGVIAKSDVNGAVLVTKSTKGEIKMIGTRVLSMIAIEISQLYPMIDSLADRRY